MTRRALLFASVTLRLHAGAGDDAWETITAAARALVEATALPPPNRGTAAAFLSYFDPKMPGFETLRAHAVALVEQADLECTLDPISNDGNDRTRNLAIDWQLRISDPGTGVVAARRQEQVKCTLEKQGRKWRIVVFEPLGLFGPPKNGVRIRARLQPCRERTRFLGFSLCAALPVAKAIPLTRSAARLKPCPDTNI